MSKEIEQDIELLKEDIKKDRSYLGPYPLTDSDKTKWHTIYENNKLLAQSINIKINTFNLIVPLMNKQKFHVEFDSICEDILVNGVHSVPKTDTLGKNEPQILVQESEDVLGVFFKALGDLFSFNEKKKSVGN